MLFYLLDTHLTIGVSNFLRDLFETSFAVAGATGRSLVLIDEFGIGTNEVTDEKLPFQYNDRNDWSCRLMVQHY